MSSKANKKWWSRRSRHSVVSNEGRPSEVKIDAQENPFNPIQIPQQIVFDIWMEVLQNVGFDFGTRHILKHSVFEFIRDALTNLDLLDMREKHIDSSGSNASSMSDDEIPREVNGTEFTKDKDCVFTVHHEINEQYGEYLRTSDAHQMRSTYSKYKVRWFQVASRVQNWNDLEMSDFRIHILPRVMAHAGRVGDVMKFLCCKEHIRERLKVLGILEGTSLIVSDIEDLINGTSKTFQPSEIAHLIDSCSEEIRTYIRCALKISEDADDRNTYLDDMSRKSHTEAGKALHLLALSIGNSGKSEVEIELLSEALNLKRLGLEKRWKVHESISISDTLHCMGLAYDNLGNAEEAINCYDQALFLRRKFLGDKDIRVAETCHNKVCS